MPDVTEVPSISLRPEDTEKRLRHARKATQTEIARALKAVKSTGLVIVRVEVEGRQDRNSNRCARIRQTSRLRPSSNGVRGNMRVRLKGINKITKRLADGSSRTYYYAWKGGPALLGDPGSPEFIRSYHDAQEARALPKPDHLSTILDAFQDSEVFRSLAPRTAEDYRRYIHTIDKKFGEFPLAGLAEREARAEFMRWRDDVARRSKRAADYGWSVLARVLSWALDRGLVDANPCERGGRVYKASRADNIWTDADEAAFLRVASPQMRLAFMLALWTGQRQGDILTVTWAAYDGDAIRFRQSKTGARVTVEAGAPLKALLGMRRLDAHCRLSRTTRAGRLPLRAFGRASGPRRRARRFRA